MCTQLFIDRKSQEASTALILLIKTEKGVQARVSNLRLLNKLVPLKKAEYN